MMNRKFKQRAGRSFVLVCVMLLLTDFTSIQLSAHNELYK